jgi:hypothetical protein
MVIKCSALKRRKRKTKNKKQKTQDKGEILIGAFWFDDRDT